MLENNEVMVERQDMVSLANAEGVQTKANTTKVRRPGVWEMIKSRVSPI